MASSATEIKVGKAMTASKMEPFSSAFRPLGGSNICASAGTATMPETD
ncbi:MAG: hypothetical protein H6575_09545 [Lewinellaceae bacterium]|nr:hypothetical protein [Lewinellaceae bacterium]